MTKLERLAKTYNEIDRIQKERARLQTEWDAALYNRDILLGDSKVPYETGDGYVWQCDCEDNPHHPSTKEKCDECCATRGEE